MDMQDKEQRYTKYYKFGEQKFDDETVLTTKVYTLRRIIEHDPAHYFMYVHFFLPVNDIGKVVPELKNASQNISVKVRGHEYNIDLKYSGGETDLGASYAKFDVFNISSAFSTIPDAIACSKEIEKKVISQFFANYVQNVQKGVIIQPFSISIDANNKVFAYATCRDTRFNHIINVFYLIPGSNPDQSMKREFMSVLHEFVVKDRAEEIGKRYMDNGQVYYMFLTQDKVNISVDVNDVIKQYREKMQNKLDSIKAQYYRIHSEVQKETNIENTYYLNVGYNKFEIDTSQTLSFDEYKMVWKSAINIDVCIEPTLDKYKFMEAISNKKVLSRVSSGARTINGVPQYNVEGYKTDIKGFGTFDEAKEASDKLTKELVNVVSDTLRNVYKEKLQDYER